MRNSILTKLLQRSSEQDVLSGRITKPTPSVAKVERISKLETLRAMHQAQVDSAERARVRRESRRAKVAAIECEALRQRAVNNFDIADAVLMAMDKLYCNHCQAIQHSYIPVNKLTGDKLPLSYGECQDGYRPTCKTCAHKLVTASPLHANAKSLDTQLESVVKLYDKPRLAGTDPYTQGDGVELAKEAGDILASLTNSFGRGFSSPHNKRPSVELSIAKQIERNDDWQQYLARFYPGGTSAYATPRVATFGSGKSAQLLHAMNTSDIHPVLANCSIFPCKRTGCETKCKGHAQTRPQRTCGCTTMSIDPTCSDVARHATLQPITTAAKPNAADYAVQPTARMTLIRVTPFGCVPYMTLYQ